MGITGAAMKVLRTVQAPFQTLNKLRRTYGESENRTEALEAIRQEPEEMARRFMGRLNAGLTLKGLNEESVTWEATLLHHFKEKVWPDIKKRLTFLYPVNLKDRKIPLYE